MVLLDQDEDDIVQMIEKGVLSWAFDIRAPKAERRELRVWRESLLEVMGYPASACAPASDEAMATILPGRDLRSPEVQRLFSCSQYHVQTLLGAGCFEAASPRLAETGPNAFTRIRRESIAAFLLERRAS